MELKPPAAASVSNRFALSAARAAPFAAILSPGRLLLMKISV
jgi:hypothetical protein